MRPSISSSLPCELEMGEFAAELASHLKGSLYLAFASPTITTMVGLTGEIIRHINGYLLHSLSHTATAAHLSK